MLLYSDELLLLYKGRCENSDNSVVFPDEHTIMIGLQMLVNVPEWARERGLDDKSFDVLEQIALKPEQKHSILKRVEYGTACCITSALEYAKSKGLIN